MASADDSSEVHGFKLVRADTYAPLWHDGATPPQRYVPGTTQWIVWTDDAHPPPAPQPCTPTALHFCQRAVDTVWFGTMFCDDCSNFVLLRVTPLRWPTAPDTAPLFVEAKGMFDPAKRGAHGLRVDGVVTDAAERRALLSGEIEREAQCPSRSKFIDTADNGRIVRTRYVDVLGNCISDNNIDRRHTTRAFYAILQTADGTVVTAATDKLDLTRICWYNEDVTWLIDHGWTLPGDDTTVVFGEGQGGVLVRILKRYTCGEIRETVKGMQ